MIFLPALTVLFNFQRSMLIANGITGPISVATAMELAGIIIVLLICTVILNLIGAIAASLAYMTGRIMSNLYLAPKYMDAVRNRKRF